MTIGDVGRSVRTLRILWSVCLVVVIIGSLLPADSAAMRTLDKLDINDKVQHILAYAALGFLPAIHERRRTLAVLLVLAAALGVLLEYGQLYSPGRSFDVYDMLADAIGIVIGAAIGLSLRPFLNGQATAAAPVGLPPPR